MNILHLDSNHPILIEQLAQLGFENHMDFESSKSKIESKINLYDGIILRSRFPIDQEFLDYGKHLKFIGRVGSGLENIDVEYAESLGIEVIGAPEGNSNAVAEHALGMLLAMMNRIIIADKEVRAGLWQREENRGFELDGKTVGIIGYGNNGRALAKKLSGFDLEVLCHDIIPNLGDQYAEQVDVDDIQKKADVLSLHIPETPETIGYVNEEFIDGFTKPFWLINTSRGKNVVTAHLMAAIKSGKILGAGLDVLEYEKSSFEQLFGDNNLPGAFRELIHSEKVILSPHIAGWTFESKEKLAQTIVDKIKAKFC